MKNLYTYTEALAKEGITNSSSARDLSEFRKTKLIKDLKSISSITVDILQVDKTARTIKFKLDGEDRLVSLPYKLDITKVQVGMKAYIYLLPEKKYIKAQLLEPEDNYQDDRYFRFPFTVLKFKQLAPPI